jgi:MFS transporter, YNFM family, putative membrane transport protein
LTVIRPSGTAFRASGRSGDHGEAAGDYLERGTPRFRRANLALFAAGFATFALIYCVQPLMPVFAAEFGVSAAASSLSLSLTTIMLAPMLIIAGSLSEVASRKAVMALSLTASAALSLAAALAPGFSWLLVARALEGIALSGLPAVAMAYLGEETHPRAVGLAVGLLIAGNGFGGMAGRLGAGVVTDLASWRVALALVGLLGLVSAVMVWRNLPPSRHFHPLRLRLGDLTRPLLGHLADPGLRWLFVLGFLLMGAFVTLYNYIAFLLLARPYALSQTAVGAIFAIYLVGMAGSALAGQLADRLGRWPVLAAYVLVMLAGVLLTLHHALAAIILGLSVTTFGFFGCHAIASSWVSRRAQAAKAQAASLYLCSVYLGSSVAGSAGGIALARFDWPGVVALVAALVAALLLISLRLRCLPPLAGDRRPRPTSP